MSVVKNYQFPRMFCVAGVLCICFVIDIYYLFCVVVVLLICDGLLFVLCCCFRVFAFQSWSIIFFKKKCFIYYKFMHTFLHSSTSIQLNAKLFFICHKNCQSKNGKLDLTPKSKFSKKLKQKFKNNLKRGLV